MSSRTQAALLFVDRASHQWIVRDPDGQFWVIPVGDNPWALRQPVFELDQLELELVPGHYMDMLALPF